MLWQCWCRFVCVKQKTAYEMRISDWSSDVCSSDLELVAGAAALGRPLVAIEAKTGDLANGGASRHRTRAQMRIKITEQMGLVGSQQSRRRTMLDALFRSGESRVGQEWVSNV